MLYTGPTRISGKSCSCFDNLAPNLEHSPQSSIDILSLIVEFYNHYPHGTEQSGRLNGRPIAALLTFIPI